MIASKSKDVFSASLDEEYNLDLFKDLFTFLQSILNIKENPAIIFCDSVVSDTLLFSCLYNRTIFSDFGISGLFPIDSVNVAEYDYASQIIYMIHSEFDRISHLIEHCMKYVNHYKNAAFNITICAIPNADAMLKERLTLFISKLSELDIATEVHFFDLGFISMGNNLLSMELHDSFKRLYIDNDIGVPFLAARAMIKLQQQFLGNISCVRAKGRFSVKTASIIKSLTEDLKYEKRLANFDKIKSNIDYLYIFDRSVDLTTALLSQLTYEGALDDLYDIKGRYIPVTPELNEINNGDEASHLPISKSARLQATLSNSKDISSILSNYILLDPSSDVVFNDIKDRNLITVGPILHQNSLMIKEMYEKRRQAHHLKDVKLFLKSLPEIQDFHHFVSFHTHLATQINHQKQDLEFHELVLCEHDIIYQLTNDNFFSDLKERIARGDSSASVLRFLCLYSSVVNGIPPQIYDSIQELCMLVYGIPEMLSVWISLEQCGLLLRKESVPSLYGSLCKQLRLTVNDLDEQNPNDISYTYSGYAPRLVRMAEILVEFPHKWKNREDFQDLIPGEYKEWRYSVSSDDSSESSSTKEVVHRYIFFVLGGITRSELSAFFFAKKKLSERLGKKYEFLICTTNLTTSKRILSSAFSVF